MAVAKEIIHINSTAFKWRLIPIRNVIHYSHMHDRLMTRGYTITTVTLNSHVQSNWWVVIYRNVSNVFTWHTWRNGQIDACQWKLNFNVIFIYGQFRATKLFQSSLAKVFVKDNPMRFNFTLFKWNMFFFLLSFSLFIIWNVGFQW